MSECCGCGAEAAAPPTGAPEVEHNPWLRDINLACSVTAGALWLLGLVLDWAGGPAIWAYALGLASGAYTFVPSTVRRLARQRGRNRLGVGLLMTIAAIGAVLLGHVGEAAALAFLFSISETLEDKAMDRARRGLRALLSIMPERARVIRREHAAAGEDTTEEIPLAEVRVGDLLLVQAGERVATDGKLESGTSWVDNSAITGESIPVEIVVGDSVLAGAVNGTGVITVRATAPGKDNSLTQIVRLVEQAHANKGQRARLADRIASPLVPLVLIVAILLAVYGLVIGQPWLWIERALVVLVAASPCALAIAVPVTVISAIGAASKLGVVIKSGAAFEELGTISTVAFDKTGTLTRNAPEIVDVHVCPGFSYEQVYATAAALEVQSQHPLAAAVIAHAQDIPAASEVVELPGLGLQGQVHGRNARVGSVQWVGAADAAERAEEMADHGMSVIAVEIDGRLAGLLGIRDELRPEVAETVAALHSQGIATVMLTGDNAQTAQVLGGQAGISQVFAEQLPADKARRVADLRAASPTAMVGDGTNDAPALAAATVGIAMGATGTAAAVESADVAFTGHDLRQLPLALAHAQRGRWIMLTNIGMALAIVIGLFPLALFGVLGLATVVFIHEIAEVVIIANGMRAARIG